MDRYQKVDKPKEELTPMKENEIRITSQGLLRNYISYASALLQERRGKEIVLKAMGQAISKTVTLAEIMKRRNPQLHQDTGIGSVSVTDVWEPIEEGLLPVEQTRRVSMVTITLSFKELNKNSPGYQAPSMEQDRAQYNYSSQQHPQPPRQNAIYNAENEGSYSRGRGRVRGRGRGWSRGGYANYQENGGYSSSARGGGYGYREDGGYPSSGRGGGYGYNEDGGYPGSGRGGGYGYRENGGYSNRDRGGGYGYGENGGYSNRVRGGGYGYGGYEGGRGSGGGNRGYGGGGRGRGARAGGQ